MEAVSVGLDRVQQARTLGTTPGKLNLVQKLQASSQAPDDINLEEWLNKPVKEIMKAIKQNKKDAKHLMLGKPTDKMMLPVHPAYPVSLSAVRRKESLRPAQRRQNRPQQSKTERQKQRQNPLQRQVPPLQVQW